MKIIVASTFEPAIFKYRVHARKKCGSTVTGYERRRGRSEMDFPPLSNSENALKIQYFKVFFFKIKAVP